MQIDTASKTIKNRFQGEMVIVIDSIASHCECEFVVEKRNNS